MKIQQLQRGTYTIVSIQRGLWTIYKILFVPSSQRQPHMRIQRENKVDRWWSNHIRVTHAQTQTIRALRAKYFKTHHMHTQPWYLIIHFRRNPVPCLHLPYVDSHFCQILLWFLDIFWNFKDEKHIRSVKLKTYSDANKD